ncbi:cadherin domain protein [Ancylostoma caninum]|uniref:Cadherin domain protein n=1 Tax=Ancylostoma caninum TaxID=29170 RepID=A0A368F0H7_ANCCA|nr:cadherin domain protein [Ancylostoma caninum]
MDGISSMIAFDSLFKWQTFLCKQVNVSIPEELPAGSIIYSLPAINPKDGSPVPITVQGDMKEAFSVDPDTGAISIAHSLDFESMAPNDRTFSLTFTAGSPGYESVAELKITVTNVDDNPPVLDKEGLHNEVSGHRLPLAYLFPLIGSVENRMSFMLSQFFHSISNRLNIRVIE